MNEFNKKIETLEKEVKEAKEIHGLARDVYTTRNLAVLNAKLRAFKEAREMFLGEINKFILTENENMLSAHQQIMNDVCEELKAVISGEKE